MIQTALHTPTQKKLNNLLQECWTINNVFGRRSERLSRRLVIIPTALLEGHGNLPALAQVGY